MRVPEWLPAAVMAAALALAGCERGPDRTEIRETVRRVGEEAAHRTTSAIHGDRDSRDDLRAQAREVARQHGLDPALLEAVIDVESGWNPRAHSHKGARGLMQIMPQTARREYGLRDSEALYEPAVNLRLGVSHLHDLLKRFCEPRMALWAWHAGAGAVDPAASRITPPESRRFVRQVLDRYRTRTDGEPVSVASSETCEQAPEVTQEPDEHVRGRRSLASGEPDSPKAPDPEITSAWISALRVRVGESVDVRIEATNHGGPAHAGEIQVSLPHHPRMQVGYGSDLKADFYAEGESYRYLGGTMAGAHDPIVLARTDDWEAGAQHTLHLRLVPGETGTITLRYRLSLEGPDGRIHRYPQPSRLGSHEGPGRSAQITVTRTLNEGGPR